MRLQEGENLIHELRPKSKVLWIRIFTWKYENPQGSPVTRAILKIKEVSPGVK
jgi:hypothetical protein